MTKIRNIIQINSGYTSYVDLYNDYYDYDKNRGRMERYKPIAAHRIVFEKIANILNPLDRRCYFLSGSYGTGKSHLLLMLANYFANTSDVKEIEAFFKNYEISQKEVLLKPGEELNEVKASALKQKRKSGRFLIALCRYSLNLDFEGALLRALEDAINKAVEEEGVDIQVDTHYLEAIRRIEDWQKRRNSDRFFTDFQSAITKQFPEWTVDDLVDGLKKYEETALKVFKSCFHTVTDSDFRYDKDNLRDIISDFLSSPKFKEHFQGIIFFYDEFGAAIDANLVDYRTMLDFAQYCANSTLEKGGTVAFIGAGHKAFRNHGQIGDLNAETLEARVSEIGIETQGMEDIIGAIVQPMKDSDEWAKYIQPQSGKFTWFSNECNRLNLFNWLPAPKIKYNIIQNIYPMHPLATYGLLRLANEAGSDNRSVFKFFSPEFETGKEGWVNVQKFSYPWFIENHEISENNKLALYTADLLVDYFKESLKATNTRLVEQVKNSVINYEATVRELNAYITRQSEQQLFDVVDELMMRIIKVIFVNEVISTKENTIPNTSQNIAFSLDFVSPEEKTRVDSRLELLCNAGILFNNHGIFELVRGDRQDIQRLVDQYKANPNNRPTNLMQSFLDQNPLRRDENFLEAKDYNAIYNEDKRFKVIFATPTMLKETNNIEGTVMSFFETLEHERISVENKYHSYEGTAVYVFCENEGDVDNARNLISDNNQERIVIAIPRNPISVYDAVLTIKALESDWFKKQAQDFSPFEKAQEKNIRDDAKKILDQAKKDYFTNTKVHWFGESGVEIPVVENKSHDAVNQIIQKLYQDKRNKFGHNEFNKIHINITGQTRAVFFEAGDILCDLGETIRINWSWPDNRGGKKYLRRCFVDHQVLKVISIEGDNRYLEPEKDISKFRGSLPAYAHLLETIASLKNNGERNLSQLLTLYFEDFGQGEIAITLMLLLARRFFGDSIRFKYEPNNLSDIQFTKTSDMLDLVQGSYPSAVILFEPVSEEEKEYFSKVVTVYSIESIPAGKLFGISEAYQTALTWWESLPIIARSTAFYNEDNQPFAELFSQSKTKDPYQFIKHDLIQLLGYQHREVLTLSKLEIIGSRLQEFKNYAEGIQRKIENRILEEVADIFNASSHLDVDIQEALKNWYTSLSSTQKDLHVDYHNNDSKPLVKYTAYVNVRELLFNTLPEAYSYGRVETWRNNEVENYTQRIRRGKNHIETKAPTVNPPIIDYENELSQHGDQVIYQGELIIHPETDNGKGVIYITHDGSDPVTSSSRRKLEPGEKLKITGNQKVKIVVADEKGNYSAIKTIDAIDNLIKYKIVRQKQRPAFDETITFIFPKDEASARITLSSLITELEKSDILNLNQLRQMTLNIIDEVATEE